MRPSRPCHLCKEVGSVTAVAGSHPGSPSHPTGSDRWPEKHCGSLRHKDKLGGYFGQVNWLPQGQSVCWLSPPSCPPGVHWGFWKKVLNCIVCELQVVWLWVIIQDQQSLMVASSDFSHFP